MNNKILLIIVFLLYNNSILAQAPEIEWQKTYGGTGNDILQSVVETSASGYLLGGESTSEISGNKTAPNLGNEDFWVVKLDSVGNILWQKTIGENSYQLLDVVLETLDNGYMLGGRNGDYYIVKIDNNGTIEWQKTYGGSSRDDFTCMQQTSDGGYFLGGTSTSEVSGNKTVPNYGSTDYWVIKIDNNGTIEWQKTYGGSGNDRLTVLLEIKSGGYLFGGWSDSHTYVGNKTVDTKGKIDYWLLRAGFTGEIIWQKSIGGDRDDELNDIQETSDGGYILGGSSNSDISGDKTESNIRYYDFWVVKLKADSPLEIVKKYSINYFKLNQNHPNPFNPTTTVSYSLDKDSDVSIAIYDLSGKLITTLLNKHQSQGEHSITWNGTDDFRNKVGAGVYFYQLRSGELVETMKMVLLR